MHKYNSRRNSIFHVLHVLLCNSYRLMKCFTQRTLSSILEFWNFRIPQIIGSLISSWIHPVHFLGVDQISPGCTRANKIFGRVRNALFVEIFARTNFCAFSYKNSKCAKIYTKISLKRWVRENKFAPKQCFDIFLFFCLYCSSLVFSAIVKKIHF